jgi:nucleotide-binding universal stress UspA family protein
MIPEHILVGTDFGDVSRAAADWAIDLARSLGARITLLHVFDLPIVGLLDASLIVDAKTAARLSDEAQAALDAEVARVKDRGVPVTGMLKQGDSRITIPAVAASEHAGMVVVGSHGRHGLSRALLGSVAETIVRTSEVPVVVVRLPPRSA